MKFPKELNFSVSVHSDLKKTPLQQLNFVNKVTDILSNPKTWPVNFIKVDDPSQADFQIHLASPAFIKKTCHFAGLSCASLLDRQIYINHSRWSRGSPHFNSSLSIYRNYLISHEVGHILGKSHPDLSKLKQKKKKGSKAPVMMQQTLGTHGYRPNGWPLKSEL